MALLPKLVASTKDAFNVSQPESPESERQKALTLNHEEDQTASSLDLDSRIFKSALWSPDGTSIVTSSADNTLRTFILPPDLLASPEAHPLQPYSSLRIATSVYATSIYPGYELSNPSAALFLAAPAHLPIRLLSPFSPGIVAVYPLVNHHTEAFTAPHSLLFEPSSGGSRFFAGSESQISIFDLSRDGNGPVSEMPTIPSRRRKQVGGGVGMKGIVSALGVSRDGVLAAGTFTRWIGLYGSGGEGDLVGVFQLGRDKWDELGSGGSSDGAGVTQVVWSECGRYLCVVERASDGVGVWDIRGSGQRLSWLCGREGRTMQRLSVSLNGTELWAGGTDGMVRVWKGIGAQEGLQDPDWEFKAHDDCVSSTLVHPCGTVFATASGQRHNFERLSIDLQADDEGQDNEDQGVIFDNSLRVWNL